MSLLTPAHHLSDRQFDAIAALVRRQFGLDLSDRKRALVHARLSRRLRALRLPGFGAYLELLQGPHGADEQAELVSALTTNVTRFFRERHHFDLFREQVLPAALARARAGGRARVWSAGCATGQEAYSLAFTLLAACPEAERYDIRILATDIDQRALDRAEAGIYASHEFAAVPDTISSTTALTDGTGRIAPSARALVRFRPLNLVAPWPLCRPFEAIFCRNVAIYFDRPAQQALWQRFAALTSPGGWLFIGHSERLSGPAAAAYARAGATAYRRTTGEAAS
ncbi:Putative MCP methyltransferase [Oceanicola granulosus HTCC2516]|uniref:Chemotaxis protein methyltransferase n=1 Tax=Oceanicola granulosus (strain ATCC BAA-861 / DSM 15982 / KCTC 12143 / HTCC2516) TaxID=314256 RepID=Q2CIS2_OCEGH|nr:CheR family methyltransferase [Oceanicola granulosus]EAR52517.1 Putative MCP methyltransferase [Oceanicola granulosus HTCC2516]